MLRIVSLLALVLMVCIGCAGGPPKRVFPPEASLQELRIDSDGRWMAVLRIRSFSTVPMTLEQVQGSLVFDNLAPIAIDLPTQVDIAAGSVELLELRFTAPAGLTDAIARVQSARGSLRYTLKGTIRASEPRGRHDFDYSSALSPVPGLGDVLR